MVLLLEDYLAHVSGRVEQLLWDVAGVAVTMGVGSAPVDIAGGVALAMHLTRHARELDDRAAAMARRRRSTWCWEC